MKTVKQIGRFNKGIIYLKLIKQNDLKFQHKSLTKNTFSIIIANLRINGTKIVAMRSVLLQNYKMQICLFISVSYKLINLQF